MGFYLMRQDSTVFASCVDFDNKPQRPDPQWESKTEKLYMALVGADLPAVVELSQSGTAAHVWLLFDKPARAGVVRQFWLRLADHIDIDAKEIYPRQDELGGKGIGNLVRYPLWNKSRFVDIENEWREQPPQEALRQKTTEEDLHIAAQKLGLGSILPRLRERSGVKQSLRFEADLATVGLLQRRWSGNTTGLKDPSRSALVLSIATELVRRYYPTDEIDAAIRRWCRENKYEKGDRDDWVRMTIEKAYEFIVSREEVRSVGASTLKDACHELLDSATLGHPHISTGIFEIDESMEGVLPGELCIIAARPSHGKTAFALQWVDKVASDGMPSLVISEEMSRAQMASRAIHGITFVPSKDWHNCRVSVKREVDAHYQDRAPIYVVEGCATIDRCEEVIAQFCSVHNVGFIVVDYLQLLSARGKDSRYEIVTDISRRLKQAAIRHACALIVLSQLNRQIDMRESRTPKLSDLRESGQIEQDADTVMFLQWPHRFDPTRSETEYQIVVAKRRNGAIRNPVIQTAFNQWRQRIGLKYV